MNSGDHAVSAQAARDGEITTEEKDFILRFLGLEAGDRFSFRGDAGTETYFVDDKGHIYRITESETGERLENADASLWRLMHNRDNLMKDRIQREGRIKLLHLLQTRFGCTRIIREDSLLFAGAAVQGDETAERALIGRKARNGLKKLMDASPGDRAAAIAALIRAVHRDSKLILLLSPEQIIQGAWGLQDGEELDIQAEIERYNEGR